MRVNLLTKNGTYQISELDDVKNNLISDLELKEIFKIAGFGDFHIKDIFPKILLDFCKNEEDIIYRQNIYKDLVKNKFLIKMLYEYLQETLTEFKSKFPYEVITNSPYSIVETSTSILEYLYPKLYAIRANIMDWKCESEGLKLFQEENVKDLDPINLDRLKRITLDFDYKIGIMTSTHLEDNLSISNVTLNRSTYGDKEFKKKWKKAIKIDFNFLSESLINEINAKNDMALKNVCVKFGQATHHIIYFLKDLYDEIGFYIASMNIEEKLNSLNIDTCIPEISDKYQYDGLYDMALALKKNMAVTPNSHETKSNVWVITGANQGGKTTFLRSLGQAYIFFQSGLFCPAKMIKLPIISGLFTHFDKEEDTKLESGKFDDELRRFNLLMDKLKPNSLFMLNESFQSTDEAEGSKIGYEIISGFIDSNIKIILVTHMYDLAMLLKEKYNDSYFLRAERLDDGSRSYKLIEAMPLTTSFGEDLYNKIWNKD